jgi:hypothetical protein
MPATCAWPITPRWADSTAARVLSLPLLHLKRTRSVEAILAAQRRKLGRRNDLPPPLRLGLEPRALRQAR